ncbi:MAG: hypothetical protein ACXWV9_10310, partial [Flavisolibacter sp.]
SCIFFARNQNYFMGPGLLHEYNSPPGVWDEMIDTHNVRPQFEKIINSLQAVDVNILHQKDKLAAELFMNQGITFTVYTDDAGIERISPFDIIRHIIISNEWKKNEEGFSKD